MEILRIYADEIGESHFGTCEFSLNLKDDSPPAKPHFFSDPRNAKSYVVVQCPVGWGEEGELHPTPRRQIVVCMSGTMRITTSLGESRDLVPGNAVLVEDIIGKGHISLVTVINTIQRAYDSTRIAFP